MFLHPFFPGVISLFCYIKQVMSNFLFHIPNMHQLILGFWGLFLVHGWSYSLNKINYNCITEAQTKHSFEFFLIIIILFFIFFHKASWVRNNESLYCQAQPQYQESWAELALVLIPPAAQLEDDLQEDNLNGRLLLITGN